MSLDRVLEMPRRAATILLQSLGDSERISRSRGRERGVCCLAGRVHRNACARRPVRSMRSAHQGRSSSPAATASSAAETSRGPAQRAAQPLTPRCTRSLTSVCACVSIRTTQWRDDSVIGDPSARHAAARSPRSRPAQRPPASDHFTINQCFEARRTRHDRQVMVVRRSSAR